MWFQVFYALGLVTGLGLMIAVGAGLGWWAGSWLDTYFATGAVWSIIGLVSGIVGSCVSAYRLLLRALATGGSDDG